ncbi:MAG: hypothetical protein Q4C22_06770 [Bacillota bacterium]|nr:hypothetical protein [Bacillota bacterium]
MHRIQKWIFIPALLTVFTGIASAYDMSEESLTLMLLEERTAILQQAYYGETEVSEAEEELAKIETHPLLGQDISRLRETLPTDMDRVFSMELLSLERQSRIHGFLTYHAEIRWKLLGAQGSYFEEHSYLVVLKSDGRNYRLSEFQAL